jgi:hypothetical protein
MGMLLVVGLIVAALVSTPLGPTIADTIERIVCEIASGGEDCGPAPREPALSDCVRSEASRAGEAHVKVAVFTLAGGVKAVREERADGSVKVTLEANADAGLEFSTPGAEVEVGGGGPEGTGQREVSVTGGGSVARSWVFDEGDAAASAEAADQFQDDVIDRVKAQIDPWPWTSGPGLPEHTETSVRGGVEVSGSAEMASGNGIEGNLGASVGGTFNEQTGEQEIFFQVNAGAAGNLQAGQFFEFGAGGDGEVRVGMVYDAEGKPVAMKVYGRAEGSVQGGLDLQGGDLDEALSDVNTNTEVGAGGRVALNAKLDLTDQQNLLAANAFIDGVNPVTGSSVEAGAAGVDLYERFRDDGEVSVQTYSTDSSTTAAEFDATVFGAGFEYNETDAELLSAYYLDGRSFQPWARCEGTDGTA